MVRGNILISVLLALPTLSFAQFRYLHDQSVTVLHENGDSLALAWSGGLNSAQFNKMDLNGDNNDDLVIFDRMADQVHTFTASNGTYQYAPEYESVFPMEVTRFLLLRDFNCDGKKDIFTGHNFGIAVFVNVTGIDGNISWERFNFYAGNSRSDHVLTQGFSQKTGIQLQFDDLPAIVDIDGDSDLDIMNARFTGNGSIEFHKNMSIERYGVCDSLDFQRVTQAWGGVTQCRCENFVFNNDDCATSSGRVKHGSGKALLVIDINNDGEKDVLFSEAECPNIFSLINHGTVDNPLITEAEHFPFAHEVDINIFPSAFYEDVDFDGIRDLIVTPNNIQRDFIDQDYNSSTWLYKNKGSNDSPDFTFVKEEFLQQHMIDAGDNSVPAFFDGDNDGDLDMFIGFYSDETGFGSIYHYTNTGNVAVPSFKLQTRDFLNISSLGLHNVKPQFTDINRDGKTDFTFIATNRATNKTNVYYLANIASEGIEYNLANIASIDLGLITNENIHFTDVNSDGFVDALIGRSTGSLQYWRNTKSQEPSFELNTGGYLGFTSDVFRQNIASFAEDLDGDGKTDLLIADHTGMLSIISDYRSKDSNGIVTELKDIVYNARTDSFELAHLGGRLWPVAVNLFNYERPSILCGNVLGGLLLLRNDGQAETFDDLILHVYPNPFTDNDLLKVTTNLPLQLQIYSALGSRVVAPLPIPANTVQSIDLSSLAKGVYILRFAAGDRYVIRRVVKH